MKRIALLILVTGLLCLTPETLERIRGCPSLIPSGACGLQGIWKGMWGPHAPNRATDRAASYPTSSEDSGRNPRAIDTNTIYARAEEENNAQRLLRVRVYRTDGSEYESSLPEPAFFSPLAEGFFGPPNHPAVFSPRTGLDAAMSAQVSEAERVGDAAVFSRCFTDYVGKRKLTETNKLTPAQVIAKLQGFNHTMPLHGYSSPGNGILGYTYLNRPDVWMNLAYHKSFNSCRSAGVLMHEFSHQAGFMHDVPGKTGTTVPYSIDNALNLCCVCDTKTACRLK